MVVVMMVLGGRGRCFLLSFLLGGGRGAVKQAAGPAGLAGHAHAEVAGLRGGDGDVGVEEGLHAGLGQAEEAGDLFWLV